MLSREKILVNLVKQQQNENVHNKQQNENVHNKDEVDLNCDITLFSNENLPPNIQGNSSQTFTSISLANQSSLDNSQLFEQDYNLEECPVNNDEKNVENKAYTVLQNMESIQEEEVSTITIIDSFNQSITLENVDNSDYVYNENVNSLSPKIIFLENVILNQPTANVVMKEMEESNVTFSENIPNDISVSSDEEPLIKYVQQETQKPKIISEENNIDQEHKSRKRKRNPENWRKNIRKSKLNQGKAYLSASGKGVEERKLGLPCNDKCSYKCTSIFSENQRQIIMDSFWNLGNIDRQREFLIRHMVKVEPKYRYYKPNSNRGNNNQYLLEINNLRHRVCKKFFHSTLSISDQMTRIARNKINQEGVLQYDMRGKHENKNKLSDDIKKAIKEHIESIPTVESHYLRAQTKRRYFEGSLNLAQLYRLYVEKCREEGVPYAKYFQYAHIFNYNYNIGFLNPKKDQCSLCTAYENSPVEERANKKLEFENHQRNKALSREQKNKDCELAKVEENQIVAVYDLQAVLPTPCGLASDFYYKSKLSTMNFTIYNIPEKMGYCYVWNETVAKRGANEIGIYVYHYLQQNCENKRVIFYSYNKLLWTK